MDDVHRGAFGVVQDPAPPLTSEEVAALDEGTPIVVIWSGGNGPHRYTVTGEPGGQRYAWVTDRPGREQLRWYNPLTFVGGERFHTRVWLAKD